MPSFDDLLTERNAAVAEAKLWLRRLQRVQGENDKLKANLAEADKCIEAWVSAYQELRLEYWRVCGEAGDHKWWREHHEEMRQLERLPDAA